MNNDVKILAIVGMSGSGKSTAVEYLTDNNNPKIYFGGIIYKAMAEAGITEITPENQREFREAIRAKEGNDFVVKRAIADVHNLINAGQKRIVLDGVYSWTEYKILRKEFPTEMLSLRQNLFVANASPSARSVHSTPRKPPNAIKPRSKTSKKAVQLLLLIITSTTIKTSSLSWSILRRS